MAATTVEQLSSKETSVLQLSTKEARSMSLVAINSIQSLEKYHIKRPNKKTYKSGAWYIGKIDGTQRIGWGQFSWSNGGCYDGNYVENKRHGEGKYTWSDGSTYVGNFYNDLRHGFGELTWSTGESYTGQFFEDMRHGVGTYVWKDGASYSGSFRNNNKCGFGALSLANGDTFEGIYKEDHKCGAGIYTHNHNGEQDVGLWKGNTLIRLCSVIEGAFLYGYVSHHFINAGENVSQNIKSANQTLSSKPNSPSREEKTEKLAECEFTVPSHFPYKSINEGLRSVLSEKGTLERMSEELINASSVGDLPTVKRIVETGLINVNVCDKTGYFALLAASVNCHIKVINYLLDNGANINQTTDEGLTCLSACHILLYAEQNYIENIAENISKENLLNAVELDKKSGNVINRNERKMILSIYEEIYKPYGDKNPKNELGEILLTHRRTSRDTDSCDESSRGSEEDSEDRVARFDPWKLDFYHRSMDRVKEVDEINRTFKDIMLNPHKLSHKNIEYIDLCCLESRNDGWSSNSDQMNHTNFSEVNKMLSTTVASIMGYDDIINNDDHKKEKSCYSNERISKLINSERRPHLLNTIELLLSRGANPSISSLPMPVLFFAVKSAEPGAVNELLKCRADTSSRLEHLKLCPLHIAVALPCNKGVIITELLLKHGADPNARDGYLENDITLGRTPLHIACSREDDYKQAKSIVGLLLSYGADPNLLCFGNAPMTLAIASGNDLVIDTLIKYDANVSLKLSHGLGSILCVAVSFQAERRRTPTKRIELVQKLMAAGANMVTPIHISNKLPSATVMDYAYHVYYQDRRISCTPYHALSSLERECYNARKELLELLASYFRAAVSEKEKELNELSPPTTEQILDRSQKRTRTYKEFRNFSLERDDDCGLGYLLVKRPKLVTTGNRRASTSAFSSKKRYRYCNECGRSVGIRLAPCPRCKEIFYCSKNCKIKLWNSRHRDECAKTTGIKSSAIDVNDVSADNTKTINSHPPKNDGKLPDRSKKRETNKTRTRDEGFLPKL